VQARRTFAERDFCCLELLQLQGCEVELFLSCCRLRARRHSSFCSFARVVPGNPPLQLRVGILLPCWLVAGSSRLCGNGAPICKFLVICAAAACTSAAAILVLQYTKRLKWQASVSKFLGEAQESFSTSKERLLGIADVMKTEMVNGLKPPGTCLRMLPSYVDNLPNGYESF